MRQRAAGARRASDRGFLPLSLDAYLELLDWTGRQLRADKRGASLALCTGTLVVTKRGRTDEEQTVYHSLTKGTAPFVEAFYREARERLSGQDDFLDLSSLLDGNRRTDFCDLGHTGPYTGADTGRAIAERLLTLMRAEKPALP